MFLAQYFITAQFLSLRRKSNPPLLPKNKTLVSLFSESPPYASLPNSKNRLIRQIQTRKTPFVVAQFKAEFKWFTGRLQANAGALTNFEVFEFLQSSGAGKDPKRVIACNVAPSEEKVYNYLKQSAASRQTRESINEFVEKSKKYNLAKAETLNITNIAPISSGEIYPIIEDADNRLGVSAEELEELAELVLQVFPPEVESNEKTQENTDVPDGPEVEASLDELKIEAGSDGTKVESS